MMCFFPKVLLVVMTAQGPQVQEVPKEALLAPLVKEIKAGHAECRKRKIGKCLVEVHLKPATGHKNFLCGEPKDTRAGTK